MDENNASLAKKPFSFKTVSIVLSVLLIASNALWLVKDRNSRLYYAAGIQKINQHRVNESISDFEKALWQNPDDPSAHFGIAWAYQLRGQTKESVDHYARTVALSEDLLSYTLNNLQFIMQNAKNQAAVEKLGKQRQLLGELQSLR